MMVEAECFSRHARDEEERHRFQQRFYAALEARCRPPVAAGLDVAVLGDINTVHRPIDHCEPEPGDAFAERPSRRWIDAFLAESPDQVRVACRVDRRVEKTRILPVSNLL